MIISSTMAFHDIPASLPIVVTLLLILITIGKQIRRGRSPSWKLPPGPSKLPLIGNLHQLGNNLHQSLWRLSQQHGPLMYLKLGRVQAIVVSSSELAKKIFKTYDLNCCSRPRLVAHDKLSYGFSDVAFAPYGEQWRQLRKICITELFSNKKVFSPFFRSVREEEVAQTMKSIACYASSSLPVNLSETLSLLTCSIICRIAFGKSYAKDFAQLHDTMRETQTVLAGFFVEDYMPAIGWIADVLSGMRGRLEKTFAKFDQFYQQLMDEHLVAAMCEQKDADDNDTLDVLLQIRGDKYLTDDCIKGLLMNILIAGTDTSSVIVEWTMAELMRQPEIMKKVQSEVRGCIDSKGVVHESDLEKLHYLKAVIKESMRKHPTAPLLLPRETMHHFQLNGYDIPPKTRIMINTWAIARDPSLWDDPEDFNPDRFVEGKDYDYKLIPFGEGRRICPGKNLGSVVVELLLANLVYCFDWSVPCGMTKEDIDMDEAPGIAVHKKSDLWLLPAIYT